jgi:hypothetical protein
MRSNSALTNLPRPASRNDTLNPWRASSPSRCHLHLYAGGGHGIWYVVTHAIRPEHL